MSAKNGTLKLDGTIMDYISFGKGQNVLIMIPGLGDGLTTVKGLALPFSLLYREFARKYRVYVFSRKRVLNEGYTSRDMAADIRKGMDMLDIDKAAVLGVSQGGTIAQYLAIDYPERVSKLILTVTYSKQNQTIQDTVSKWIDWAEKGQYGDISVDTAKKSYSDVYLKKNSAYFPLLRLIGKPKSAERFLIMAKACLTHDSAGEIGSITCPTLIIGGKEDKIVTGEASEEIAELISGSELYMYDGLGHGLYEEAKDYNRRVLEFLQK